MGGTEQEEGAVSSPPDWQMQKVADRMVAWGLSLERSGDATRIVVAPRTPGTWMLGPENLWNFRVVCYLIVGLVAIITRELPSVCTGLALGIALAGVILGEAIVALRNSGRLRRFIEFQVTAESLCATVRSPIGWRWQRVWRRSLIAKVEWHESTRRVLIQLNDGSAAPVRVPGDAEAGIEVARLLQEALFPSADTEAPFGRTIGSPAALPRQFPSRDRSG